MLQTQNLRTCSRSEDARVGHDFTADNEPLDLRGSLVDGEDAGVTVELLDGGLSVESHAAEDLDGVVGGLVGVVSGKALGHRSPQGVPASSVDLASGLVGHETGHLDTGSHVGDHKGNGLVLEDGLAHRLTLEGILDRLVHRAASDSDGSDGDGGTSVIEGSHGNLEAIALLAEAVLLGDHDVLKGEATGVRAALAEVDLLPADGQTLGVGLDDESGHSLVARSRVGLGQNKEPVGLARVGDPHLGAVEDVLVALLHGGGADAGDIGSSARLSHTIGGLERSLNETSEVLLLLLLVTGDDDGHGGERVGLDGGLHTSARISELLLDDDTVPVVVLQS